MASRLIAKPFKHGGSSMPTTFYLFAFVLVAMLVGSAIGIR
ncbi:hypothetical protein [Reyranella sp.]